MVKKVQCPHCSKRLSGEGNLKRHLRTIHRSIKQD
ncbi:MAG: hypothetical protein K5782_00835 [Nitrosarchaeum sp.]|nr:hypothetical protein [Nitrosarchaeum sp.]